ncbi:MAG: hypothetical protein L7F78_18765, partial [Syntrophales bacterium LBB04]|nr:hypothetical protein [Syntrophales bacterium LBB04]
KKEGEIVRRRQGLQLEADASMHKLSFFILAGAGDYPFPSFSGEETPSRFLCLNGRLLRSIQLHGRGAVPEKKVPTRYACAD